MKVRKNLSNTIRFEDIKLSILALWRKKWLIVATTLFTSLVGLFLTAKTVAINTYVAEASVYSAAYGSIQESNSGAAAMITYSDIVSSRKVCERAASLLSGEYTVEASDIQKMISANQESSTIMGIYAYSTSPEVAVKVANAVAESFVHEITSITGSDSVQLLDTANQVGMASNGSRDLLKKRLIFVMLGLLASSGWIALTELFSNRIKTVEQCIDQDEREVLGIIPYVSNKEW